MLGSLEFILRATGGVGGLLSREVHTKTPQFSKSLNPYLHYFHQLHRLYPYFKIFFVLFPQDVILKFRDKIEKMEKDIYAVLRLEAEEKEMQHSEAQVRLCSGPQGHSVSTLHRPL